MLVSTVVKNSTASSGVEFVTIVLISSETFNSLITSTKTSLSLTISIIEETSDKEISIDSPVSFAVSTLPTISVIFVETSGWYPAQPSSS